MTANKTGIPVVDDAIKSVRTQSNDEKVNNLVANALNALITQSKGWADQESGWVSGGELVQDSDGVRINPGVIRIHNYNLEDPRLTFVSFPGTKLNFEADQTDFLYVDLSGVITRTALSPEDFRIKVQIGIISWVSATHGVISDSANVNAAEYERSIVLGPELYGYRDQTLEGSTGRTIKVSEGKYFYHGLRPKTNPEAPHQSDLYAAQDPMPFYIVYQIATGFYNTVVPQTDMPLAIYDDGSGTDLLFPTGILQNQWWTADEVYVLAGSGVFAIAIGQQIYATSDEAVAAVDQGNLAFNRSPASLTARLHGHIIRRGGAIDYTSIADAIVHNHFTSH